MRLTQQADQEIRKSLDVLSDDRRTAEFYWHNAIDTEASTKKARQMALIECQRKQANYDKHKTELDPPKIFDPDFSIKNLKRLGAKQVYKKVLYVKIGHLGSKDYKSRLVTEEDKIIFKSQWEKFNEQERREEARPTHNQNIHKEQKEISFITGGPQYNTPSFGEFNYTIEIN